MQLLLVQIEFLHFAVHLGGHLARLPQSLGLAGAVLIPLELRMHVLRLVDDELGRRLLQHGDAGGTLELLGGHRTAAPEDLLLVLAHDQEANAIGPMAFCRWTS